MKILAFLAAAAGILAFLYVKAHGIDADKNAAIVAHLLELKQLEATLNQDILRGRYDRLQDYDDLNTTVAREHTLLGELRFGDDRVDRMWGGKLKLRLNDYAKLHKARTELVWTFEGWNSVLRQLVDRLPELASIVERRLRQSGADADMLELVHIIQDGVLLYIARGGTSARDELDGWISMLELNLVGTPAANLPDMRSFLEGTHALITYKTGIEDLLSRLFALDAGRAIDDLHLAYVSAYQAEQRTAETYRRLMFLFGGVMLCYIGYILTRLRRSVSAHDLANRRLQAQALELEASNRGLEREIEERQRVEVNLMRAKEAAEYANRAKSDFLANMSHELRTPLNAIIGFSEIMREQMFGALGHDNYVEYMDHIHESGTHLLAVINDILDLSKIEAGRFTISDEEVDVAEVIRSSANILEEKARSAGLALSVELPADLPILRGDSRALRQVLFNLISNAVKFTQPGGRIVVRAGLEPSGELAVAVTDTGIGIAGGDLERVMEPFGQVETSLTRRHQGTGLGLPLAKKLVDAHDGALTVESKLGVGTTVIARFPAERVIGRRATVAA